LSGSGPRGRITRGDVLAAAGVTDGPPAPVAPTAPAAAPAPVAPTAPAAPTAPTVPTDLADQTAGVEIREPHRTEALIARRMAEAKATVPDFEVELDVVMDQILAMRAEVKDLEEAVPSINDFVVKACAIALRRHPRVNASYTDGNFKLHRRIN